MQDEKQVNNLKKAHYYEVLAEESTDLIQKTRYLVLAIDYSTKHILELTIQLDEKLKTLHAPTSSTDTDQQQHQ